MLLFFGLMIIASMTYNTLGEPEMTRDVQITTNGIEMSDPTPNPNYISGVKRTIYEFFVDFLPTGQGLQMWQLKIGNSVRMLLSSIVITILTTLAFHFFSFFFLFKQI